VSLYHMMLVVSFLFFQWNIRAHARRTRRKWGQSQSRQSAKVFLQSSKLGLPTPSPASVNYCDIFMQYYATKKINRQLYLPTLWVLYFECTFREGFLQDFSTVISHCSTKCCSDAGKRFMSSRNTVSLKRQKCSCRQDSLL
jgi:hypothetical protein